MDTDRPATVPMVPRRFQHVFVLCTGRCGSVTFAKACTQFTNYTVGHETNRATGEARLAYPKGHIEVDNRLAWFLGGLEDRYGDEAFYVHLVRDDARVAASYDRRWHHHGSLIRGFDDGICGHRLPSPETAAHLVATVNANIRAFLQNKTNVIVGDIDTVQEWFPSFAAAIGAGGDLEGAIAEFANRHNATEPEAGDDAADAAARRSRESLSVVRLAKQNEALAGDATRLRDESARFHTKATRLKAEVSRLRAEKARLQRKLKRFRRLVWALAAPWLVMAAPVALPLAWLATRRRRQKGLSARSRGRRWPGLLLSAQAGQRTLVYDAFLAYRTDGSERAAAILEKAGSACPQGAKDLFRAMAATTDEEWLTATNAWAANAAVSEVALRPGDGPRFHRITFAAADPVLSPDKVSVIMPAHNARETIELAARSILDQSWRNLELIIVDDASNDGTAEMAGRLAATDPRVRVLRNAMNVGPYVSKNRGLLAATGRYVTGHDADDIAIPTRIADQMQPIRDDAGCAATIGFMVRLDRDGCFSYPGKIGTYSYDGIARRAMISLLVERDVLLSQVGFWDCVRFGGDSEILARATAVLGPRLRDVRKVVMLCLNAEGSLTNHAEHGVSLYEGVSPIRKEYCEAWTAWHAATPVEARRLPFPHTQRLFPAPEGMLVSAESLRAVTAANENQLLRVA